MTTPEMIFRSYNDPMDWEITSYNSPSETGQLDGGDSPMSGVPSPLAHTNTNTRASKRRKLNNGKSLELDTTNTAVSGTTAITAPFLSLSHGLIEEMLFYIYSFLPFAEIEDTLPLLSHQVRDLFRRRLLDGSFLFLREKRCFVKLLYGAKLESIPVLRHRDGYFTVGNSSLRVSSADDNQVYVATSSHGTTEESGAENGIADSLASIRCGFPQLYHDCYHIDQNKTSILYRDIWTRVVHIAHLKGADLDVEYTDFRADYQNISSSEEMDSLDSIEAPCFSDPVFLNMLLDMDSCMDDYSEISEMMSRKMLRDLNFFRKAVRCGHGHLLSSAAPNVRSNLMLMEEAVQKSGDLLMYASDSLKDRQSLVEMAVMNCGFALMYASERLRDNLEVVELVLEKAEDDDTQTIVEAVSERIRSNADFMLRMIRREPTVSTYIPLSLRKQKEFMAKVLRLYPSALKILPEPLSTDRELLMEALLQAPTLFSNIDSKLKKDVQFCEMLVKRNPTFYTEFSYTLRCRRDLSEVAIRQVSARSAAEIVTSIPDILLSEEGFLSVVLKAHPNQLTRMPSWIQEDVELIKRLIPENVALLNCVGTNIVCDDEMMLSLIEKNASAFLYSHSRQNHKFILQALRRNGKVFPLINKDFLFDTKFVKSLLKQDGMLLSELPERMRQNIDLVIAAVVQNPNALSLVSSSTKKKFQSLQEILNGNEELLGKSSDLRKGKKGKK